MSGPKQEHGPGRSAEKRRAILDTATELFLRNGFRGTSMDEVASQAGVSKQTVYKQFTDKERLFREIVEGVTGNAQAVTSALTSAFGDPPATTPEGFEVRLRTVARVYLDAVLSTRVLSLRRLIIAEAEQFPDLARRYYEQAPARGIDVIRDRLEPYVASGLLAARDLRVAATHFAYLALAPAQDRAMFIPGELPAHAEREGLASVAAQVFLDAYGARAR